MALEQTRPTGQTRNIDLKELSGVLEDELNPWRKHDEPVVLSYLSALIDLGRMQDKLREEVIEKVKGCAYMPLLDNPDYPQLKWHGALLVSDPRGDDAALFRQWGECNGDIISAWIIRKVNPRVLAEHLRQSAFAYDQDKRRYLLRYYDPLILPVLHRLADRQWARWFFTPIAAWWYPVATPTEETWSRLGGEGKREIPQPAVPLLLSEELWDALKSDPFPYRLLNFAEQKYPFLFEGDCYGVRLAKIENLLEKSREKGLTVDNDRVAYVLALLEDPARNEDSRWQAAVQGAAAGKMPLKTYLTQARAETPINR